MDWRAGEDYVVDSPLDLGADGPIADVRALVSAYQRKGGLQGVAVRVGTKDRVITVERAVGQPTQSIDLAVQHRMSATDSPVHPVHGDQAHAAASALRDMKRWFAGGELATETYPDLTKSLSDREMPPALASQAQAETTAFALPATMAPSAEAVVARKLPAVNREKKQVWAQSRGAGDEAVPPAERGNTRVAQIPKMTVPAQPIVAAPAPVPAPEPAAPIPGAQAQLRNNALALGAVRDPKATLAASGQIEPTRPVKANASSTVELGSEGLSLPKMETPDLVTATVDVTANPDKPAITTLTPVMVQSGEEIWRAPHGSTLQTTIRDWAARKNWALVWNDERPDLEVVGNVEVTGDLVDAVTYLFDVYRKSGAKFSVDIYTKQQLILVKE